jgi:periplasmic protein TonB
MTGFVCADVQWCFHMTATNHNRFLLPAWSASLALHGIVVMLAMLFAAQVRPVLQEETFKWDVALVDAVQTDSPQDLAPVQAPAPTEPMVRPIQPQARPMPPRPVEPPPDTVMHRVAPQQTVQMVHPEVQPSKPVEQRDEPPPAPKLEPPAPLAKLPQEKPIEPVEQPVAEVPKTKPEPAAPAKEPEPLRSAEPLVAERQEVATPPSNPVDTRPAETPAPSAAAPLTSSQPEPAPSSPATPMPQEAPMQTAKTAQGPAASETPVQTSKADHRWLAESLWRRVAELKRYPSSARLNGQEGKVVLKAIIRSDGHLIEVTVQKSSGHQILDAAAIEAVKLA